MRRRVLGWATALTVVAGLGVTGPSAQEPTPALPGSGGPDDVVVVAVVDGSFNPYHWDFSAERQPQNTDADPANDLPLEEAPDTWLPGFDPSGFASYEALDLTLSPDEPADVAALQAADAEQWRGMPVSTSAEAHYRWIPGTKVVGAVRYGTGAFQAGNTAHGNGTSSVAVGNLHGACPQCVVVLVTYGGGDREAASDWAMSQPWIDVVTNSFGFSAVERERLYSGSDTELQRQATERGQQILFSSGNGISNTFTVPNTTLFSSQEGPDWIITVGGVTPTGGNYTGAGKPADIASVGSGYPSAYGGTTTDGRGNFSGTSNATPVAAGMLASALARARTTMAGPSRVQDGGAVSTGTATCGAARPDCEVGDGVLTGAELRTRFFEAVQRTPQGLNPGGVVTTPVVSQEAELASEGYGTYFGRLRGDAAWQAELDGITGPLTGAAPALERSADERDWMVVDSWCRQQLWGSWDQGAWSEGDPLPGTDPAWPLRSTLESTCDTLFPPL